MAQIAGLSDLRKHGPPADIGTFQLSVTSIVFKFTFSGTTYTVAMAAGVGSWTLIAQSAAGADDVEINAALVFVNTLGGGKILILQGTYDISATITGQNNVDIGGMGYATNLVVSANVNGITAANRSTISDLRLTESASVLAAFYFSNKNNYKVQNVTIVGFRYGVHSRFGIEFEISGCKIEATDLYGIYSEGSDRGIIHDNIMEDVIVTGIYIQRPLRLTVRGNEIINMAPPAAGSARCIFVTNHAAEEADSVNIIGNVLRINGTTEGDDVFGIVVSGEASDTHLTSNITIIGNNVYGDGGADCRRGIYIHGDSEADKTTREITVVGNTVEGMEDGIVATFTQKSVIVGNTVDVSGNGLWLSVSEQCDVFGNTVTADVGITESGNDNYIGRNNFSGCTTVAAITGTNTRLATVPIQLIQGTTFISAAGSPWGWEIDADTEFALGIGWLPLEVQQVIRIRVIGVGLAAPGAGNYMRIQITGEGATFDEVYTTEPIDVVNHDNEEVNFAIDDVINWVFDATDDVDIEHLLGGDRLQLKVLHEGAGNGNIATDAIVDSIQIEYV